MSQELIHVYLMPGMAASPQIFEYIKLPNEQFQIHYLEWMLPIENETLKAYALRMNQHIHHDQIVLLGVSFGGILVQEMSRHIKVKKLIIVSSVKSSSELPKRFLLLKWTRAYKLLPTKWISNIKLFSKYAFGENVQRRLDLYKRYLSFNQPEYLKWAIEQLVCWKQQEVIPKIVHIHGDHDHVFPIKHISDCMTIKGGTHVMIINKFRWFNTHLPTIILEG
ncbi:alpha/beta hydrolase [Aestuariivivens sediminis]|uniref:alpha/beta hydrolase n=1 Tax=Aestuariivivens sediminis TaxID=2913557 RepID=UPI001F589E5F|nr:alpha/beta hydrolase [Aestuariivivens sediminis]